MIMKVVRRTIVGIGMALAAAVACAEDTAAAPVALNIKSQPIADALNQWAQATGWQVIFPEEMATAFLVSPEVKGKYAPQVALGQLLAGTSLHYEFINERTVAIRGVEEGSGKPIAGDANSPALVR